MGQSHRKIQVAGTMSILVVLLCSSIALTNAAPQLFGSSPLPAVSPPRNKEQDIVSSVITVLSPSIAKAVADALASRGSSSSRPSSLRPGSSSGGLNTESLATPANYQFSYRVANDNTQTYIAQEESRDGNEVKGMYSYVDPTGAIVTVNYQAGVGGYTETRSRQEGAVKIAPQPATGAGGSLTSGLDTQAIIRQVLAALKPTIEQTVNSVVGGRRG